MDIIRYFTETIQYLFQIINWLLTFICKYIPLRQWAFDDSNSPKYQKFKTDVLPVIVDPLPKLNWKSIVADYPKSHDGKLLKPVSRRGKYSPPADCSCPRCSAPSDYLYCNNGALGQLLCKVCNTRFFPGTQNSFSSLHLKCPYCSHTLVQIKSRKHFVIHKCINPKCSYYLSNLKKVDPQDLADEEKYKYKLHYIYREFVVDFFSMDINSLPKNASTLRFSKHNAHIMGLCLTLHVNLGLSLRKTAQALKDLYGISISHQQVANYCTTAALCIKPFVDSFDYKKGSTFTADETYIKVKGVKAYVWLIMDAASRAVIGYRVSDTRSVGPCILAMRMAFKHLEKLPENFRFIADGFSAYPLAAQQFLLKFGEKFKFAVTQVIGLSNDDAVSAQFRPYKQMIERLNRTYKASYRPTNGFNNFDGANYDLALWVAYYNFLRPHSYLRGRAPAEADFLNQASLMPDKWQLMIFYGQQTILNLQKQSAG